jgi:Glycosyl hydrolases family 32 N-terminal domain
VIHFVNCDVPLRKFKMSFTLKVILFAISFQLSTVLASLTCPHVLFFHFREQESLYLSYSNDAQVWLTVNSGFPILNTTNGVPGLRDPFVFQAHDGTEYIMVATNGANFGGVNNILTFSTKDFSSWTQNIVVFQPVNGTTIDVWAPEFFYDETTASYLIFCAIQGENNTSVEYESSCSNENDSRFRFWYSHTRDFINLDHDLTLMFDPGCNDTTNGMGGIDGDIKVNEQGQFVFSFKDARGRSEDVRGIRLAVASSLTGPYGSISDLLAPVHVEAPELLRVSDVSNGDPQDEWLLFYDCTFFPTPNGWPRPPYGVSSTTSLSNFSFQQLPGACTGDSSQTAFPKGATHGSFLCVDDAELLKVLSTLGP